MVGRQALEIEFLKRALINAPRPRSVNTSVIAGPAASPSQKDAGFSNRPFGVKRFQTIHHCIVDVAHGLALLFGIGTKALVWDF
jgi:hypothetical protein